jgi:hypothetical protein
MKLEEKNKDPSKLTPVFRNAYAAVVMIFVKIVQHRPCAKDHKLLNKTRQKKYLIKNG